MSSPSAVSTYYPHINGLRAIAILGVLFYHLRADYCPAGYFGVDVFLVVSGFLLFRSLLKPGAGQGFRYGDYLMKKAWRIIPSWFVVTLVVCGVAIYLFHSSRMTDILKTGRHSSVFLADYFIDKNGDYFNVFSLQNPLLHYWYLSITQQLYIIAPLLVIPLARWCSRRASIILLAVLGVFSLAFYVLTSSPGLVPVSCSGSLLHSIGAKTAYYHLIPRLWEVAAGYAVFLLPPFESSPVLRGWLGILGLAGIVVSYFLFDTGSAAVYLTVVSSLMVLRYASGGMAACILNSRPVQAVGTISFSLYLWHWPIMVFWKYLSFDKPDVWDEMGMVALSLAMGTLSWWAIERIKTPARWLWRGALLLLIPICAALTLYGHFYLQDRNGELGNAPQISVLNEAVEETDESLLAGTEFLDGYSERDKFLRVGTPTVAPSFFLMGDSHALHYYDALSAICTENGLRGIFMTAKMVPFWYMKVEPNSQDLVYWNEAFANKLLEYLERHPEITHVVISEYWGYRFESSGNFPTSDWRSGKTVTSRTECRALAVRGLEEMCERLRAIGKVPVLIGETPCFPLPSPMDEWQRCQQMNRTYRGRWCYQAEFDREAGFANGVHERLASEGKALYLPAAPALLENGHYPDRMNGEFLYLDKDHLSRAGADRVIRSIFPRLKESIEAAKPASPADGENGRQP